MAVKSFNKKWRVRNKTIYVYTREIQKEVFDTYGAEVPFLHGLLPKGKFL